MGIWIDTTNFEFQEFYQGAFLYFYFAAACIIFLPQSIEHNKNFEQHPLHQRRHLLFLQYEKILAGA